MPKDSNLPKSESIIQFEIYSNMSYAQKWKEMLKLRETAWVLKLAGLRALHPEWNEQQIKDEVKRIFLYATT